MVLEAYLSLKDVYLPKIKTSNEPDKILGGNCNKIGDGRR